MRKKNLTKRILYTFRKIFERTTKNCKYSVLMSHSRRDKPNIHAAPDPSEIFFCFRPQNIITPAAVALQHDRASLNVCRDTAAPAGANDTAVRRHLMDAIYGLQQYALFFNKIFVVVGVQRLKLRLIKGQKLLDTPPSSDVPKLEMIMLAKHLFQLNTAKIFQRINRAVLFPADDAAHGERDLAAAVKAFADGLLMPASITAKYGAAGREIRNIMYMYLAAASTVKRHGTHFPDEHARHSFLSRYRPRLDFSLGIISLFSKKILLSHEFFPKK